MKTRSDIRVITKVSVTILIATLIVAYGVWRSLNFTKGPKIDVMSPALGASIPQNTTDIIGRAERVSNVSLNGRSIPIDTEGNFKETVIIEKGFNVFKIEAIDRFGRSTSKILEIIGSQ